LAWIIAKPARKKNLAGCFNEMTKISRYGGKTRMLTNSCSYQKRRQAEQEKTTTKEIEQGIKNEIRTRIQQAHKQAEVCALRSDP
jgi:hypothetical protein